VFITAGDNRKNYKYGEGTLEEIWNKSIKVKLVTKGLLECPPVI
jgi:hypothetical protein